MDRLIHTALNSLGNLRDQKVISANNLANLAVPGFRRDLANEGSAHFIVSDDSLPARALQLERGVHGFSRAAGPLERTGDPMDIAIADGGFFYVMPPGGGDPALSRRGDLQIGPGGQLQNGAGEALLGLDLQPIILPPSRDMVVDDMGQISVLPLDGTEADRFLIATLASVDPGPDIALRKSPDGRIRTLDGGPLPEPTQAARLLQGMREGSNVNATAELIDSIELQRTFEINLRMIQTAKEIDEAGASLLRMPSG